MKLALHWKILIGMLLGLIWSFISIKFNLNAFTLDWINPFGDIFMRILKLIAVPLVLFSILGGITDLAESNKLGRLGAKTIAAYMITTLVAVSLGLVLVNVFKPGEATGEEQRLKYRISYELWALENEQEVKDDLNVLNDPQHAELVAQVLAQGDREIDPEFRKKMDSAGSTADSGPLQFIVDMVPTNIFGALGSSSMMQIIFFAIFFGITLLFVPNKSKVAPVKAFIDGANEIFLKMVDVVMQAAPFFVFALLAGLLAKMASSFDELFGIFRTLGSYALVLLLGLGLLVFVIYPLAMVTFTKGISYRDFFRSISPAQLMAFSTSSSAATLPVTMDCVRENLGVSPQVTSFVLPIGATVNMDGTSMYQAIGAVFLAQLHMVDLDLAQQLTIVATATLASIGSAAVPSAGLIMMIIVLTSVGLPGEWVAIILAIDRPLDMCRTVVNVTGDCTVASMIAQSENELDFHHKDKIDNLEL
ncbi:MAG: Na+/H+-dicarboxylate symporter [Limisphaerales bacterium]|jgi:Na+/H+-dicarboxylate symporter